jgi:hypothetical protein
MKSSNPAWRGPNAPCVEKEEPLAEVVRPTADPLLGCFPPRSKNLFKISHQHLRQNKDLADWLSSAQ